MVISAYPAIMNLKKYIFIRLCRSGDKCSRLLRICVFASIIGLLSACSSGSGSDSAPFSLRSLPVALVLQEGDSAGLDIPLDLTREDGHEDPVILTIAGVQAQDSAFISTVFGSDTLTPSVNQTNVNLKLNVGVMPILPQQRSFRITASDGDQTDTIIVNVDVLPVERDDVYLLIGQSNMVGFGGDGTKDAGPGGPDEANDRIKQFNVSRNDEFTVFLSTDDYTSVDVNFIEPRMTNAIDPLHIPVEPSTLDKEEDFIGLGLTFAKEALPATSRNIILVPAAWSGTAFCNTTIAPGQWNPLPTNEPFHGNTLMFDRALTRINHALEFSGGVLRGILWHQGESDANSECSGRYADNLQLLAEQLRTRIIPDIRGTAARAADANVPFVVGTMSRGADARGDLSDFSPEKTLVDEAHRNIRNRVRHSAVSIHDDLTPANGFPCGNTSCIHFGTRALREMGRRYYRAMLEAAGN